MNTMIMWEFRYAGECFLLGFILMLLYDLLKIIRLMIKHPNWLIASEDIVYWVLCGSSMFLLLYKEDRGSIRWFAVGFTIAGMIMYYLIVSRNLIPLIEKLQKSYSKKVQVLLQKIRKKDKIK